ncbi:DUF4258 domain-containing protein [Paenibacillus alvei]|uniref:DUF4258 domain-containing protein n=1 Tax=Paenibacillus alvei TaxID=44250 RepID=UPI00028915F4|nr:DUF4258 domain-containing protein [Paenibacillus alvei]EJW14074.1 hypothetical protein PAV_141p01800 [Paenibacillus alvei DSM 29]MCY9545008.1 DUF4258 domain-containing protein [Paenibacillus alvei]MCY9707774.1 DUF4258 domain-containing protein [Paenibacillus alvei]MEC0082713.1 DUF4258 domain-containing protein [Paenibacillus alvei]
MDERVIFQMIAQMLDANKDEFTYHAIKRMRERNIETSDVYDILRNPTEVDDERESEDQMFTGKYNYRVKGKFEWSVVISIDFPNNMFIVTVID